MTNRATIITNTHAELTCARKMQQRTLPSAIFTHPPRIINESPICIHADKALQSSSAHSHGRVFGTDLLVHINGSDNDDDDDGDERVRAAE